MYLRHCQREQWTFSGQTGCLLRGNPYSPFMALEHTLWHQNKNKLLSIWVLIAVMCVVTASDTQCLAVPPLEINLILHTYIHTCVKYLSQMLCHNQLFCKCFNELDFVQNKTCLWVKKEEMVVTQIWLHLCTNFIVDSQRVCTVMVSFLFVSFLILFASNPTADPLEIPQFCFSVWQITKKFSSPCKIPYNCIFSLY